METYLVLPRGFHVWGDVNEHSNDGDVEYIPNLCNLTLFNEWSKSIPTIN